MLVTEAKKTYCKNPRFDPGSLWICRSSSFIDSISTIICNICRDSVTTSKNTQLVVVEIVILVVVGLIVVFIKVIVVLVVCNGSTTQLVVVEIVILVVVVLIVVFIKVIVLIVVCNVYL